MRSCRMATHSTERQHALALDKVFAVERLTLGPEHRLEYAKFVVHRFGAFCRAVLSNVGQEDLEIVQPPEGFLRLFQTRNDLCRRHHTCVVGYLNTVAELLRRDTHRVEAVRHVYTGCVRDCQCDGVRCRDHLASNLRGDVPPVRGEVSGEARVTDVLGLRSQVDSVKILQHFHARPILFRADISPQSCDAAGRAGELSFHLGKQSLGDIQLTHSP